VGRAARSLPGTRALRHAIAFLAHTFHTPIGDLHDMPLADLAGWMEEARAIWRAKTPQQ